MSRGWEDRVFEFLTCSRVRPLLLALSLHFEEQDYRGPRTNHLDFKTALVLMFMINVGVGRRGLVKWFFGLRQAGTACLLCPPGPPTLYKSLKKYVVGLLAA